MATGTISKFVIAMVWVSFFAASFAIFTADTVTNYNAVINDSKLESLNKLSLLQSKVDNYQTKAEEQRTNTGVVDLVGDFISRGYQTLLITMDSLDVFKTMTDEALSQINLPLMNLLSSAIIVTITILIVIGVIISAIFKMDL